jgi:hypothetical protein
MYPNNNSIINYNYVAPPPVIPSYIEKEILQKTLTKYEINPLITYLYRHYSEDEVINSFKKYQELLCFGKWIIQVIYVQVR